MHGRFAYGRWNQSRQTEAKPILPLVPRDRPDPRRRDEIWSERYSRGRQEGTAVNPGRVAKLLGVTAVDVRKWVADGELKVMDTSVTDRAFEAFCLQHSSELNFGLMDPAVAKWLIDEYGLETVTTH